MFLTEENKIDNTPISGYQLLYEHEVAWNNLMSEIAYEEHLSIVNEDSQMLLENKMTEWLGKVKRWFQWMASEFVRYMTKIADWWTKIQARFRAWNLDEDLKKSLSSKKIEISAKSEFIMQQVLGSGLLGKKSAELFKNEIDAYLNAVEAKKEFSEQDQIPKAFEAWNSKVSPLLQQADQQNDGDKPLAEKDLVFIVNWIKNDYVEWIKCLTYAKDQVAKSANIGIKAEGSDSTQVNMIKRNVSSMKEKISRVISLVNRAVKACIDAFGKAKNANNNGGGAGGGANPAGGGQGQPAPYQRVFKKDKNGGFTIKTVYSALNSGDEYALAKNGPLAGKHPFLFESKRAVDYFN